MNTNKSVSKYEYKQKLAYCCGTTQNYNTQHRARDCGHNCRGHDLWGLLGDFIMQFCEFVTSVFEEPFHREDGFNTLLRSLCKHVPDYRS